MVTYATSYAAAVAANGPSNGMSVEFMRIYILLLIFFFRCM